MKNKFKEKYTNLFSLIIAIVLIFFGINRLNIILRPIDTDGALPQVESFHSLENNTVDVLIYGSSHAFRGFDTRVLYRDYGISAYNYSWNWQQLNTTRAWIKDSFTTQKPKVILIETYNIGKVLTNRTLNAEIYYSRYLHNKEAKKEYLKQCFGSDVKKYLSYYIPTYGFHDNWSLLNNFDSFKKPDISNGLLKSMGFSVSKNSTKINIPNQQSSIQKEFSNDVINVLNDIVEACRKNNVDIIFYTAPYEGEFEYADAIGEYSEKNGYKYFNFFNMLDELSINQDEDFSDDGHMNTNGSVKIANFFGNYLINNYSLQDTRLIEDNMWEKYVE